MTVIVDKGCIYDIEGNTVFLGDIHGNTYYVEHFIEQCNSSKHVIDSVVLMGDIGVGFDVNNGKDQTLKRLSIIACEQDVTINIILGNHDNRRLMEHSFGVVTDGWGVVAVADNLPGLVWLTDGSVAHVADKNWVVWGGAVSVDKHRRTKNYDWWDTEVRSIQDCESIFDQLFSCDIQGLLCHDCPTSTINKCTRPGYIPSFTTKELLSEAKVWSTMLDNLIDICGITDVIHGHMHTFYDYLNIDKGIRTIGLGNMDTQSNQRFWVFDKELISYENCCTRI